MKHIYLNLKRFDVPTEYGGVNRIAPVADWAEFIVKNTVRLPPWWQQAVRLPSLDTVRREMIRWVSWLRLALLIPTQ